MSQFSILEDQTTGVHVAYYDRAGKDPDAPPTVFLHGLGSSSIVAFAGILDHPELRKHRLILVDLPGFGFSDKPDSWSYAIEEQAEIVSAAISALADRPVRIVGHSMGGAIAIVCAARHPALVLHLIVAEPNLDPGVGTLSDHIAGQSEQLYVARGHHALIGVTARRGAAGDVSAAHYAATLRLASPTAMHRSAVSLLADRAPTFRGQFLGLRIPRTTITGERSLPEASHELHSDVRGYVVPGAGHAMMTDNPTGFAEALAHAIKE